MLPVKSKYKIGKRLGAAIFEQCQNQKFALSEARSKNRKDRRGKRGSSDYGRQLIEKQRVRFTYGLSERQLSNYAKVAFATPDPSSFLHKALEMRADNVVYRAGLAPTRRSARQMVSHGHIRVNDRRITVPSHNIRVGDILSVREGSRNKSLFAKLNEPEEQSRTKPAWVTLDTGLMRAEVVGAPSYSLAETGIDYATVFEFYSR